MASGFPQQTEGTEDEAGNLEAGARAETILVVEDDASVRRLCLRALRQMGYRAESAKDGHAALEALESMPRCDLVLTDIVMPPGMNGKELASVIRERHPGLRIVYMSGYSAGILNDEALRDDYVLLTKPFTMDELRQAVERCLS
jgi:DNA-binding NtrC family response regulator